MTSSEGPPGLYSEDGVISANDLASCGSGTFSYFFFEKENERFFPNQGILSIMKHDQYVLFRISESNSSKLDVVHSVT